MPSGFDILENAKKILDDLNKAHILSAQGSTQPNEPQKKQQPEDNKMKTGTKKVHKIAKGRAVEKLVDRLSSLRTFERLGIKLERWLGNEDSAENKQELQALRDRLSKLDTERKEVVSLASQLQAKGYKPPKRQGVAGLKFDHGKRVWLKPQHFTTFASVYDPEQLNNMYVDTVIEGRVFVSLGDPNQGPAIKIPLAKQMLQMSQAA